MTMTIEERVTYIENHLGIVHDPPTPTGWEELLRLQTPGVDTYAVPYTGYQHCGELIPYQKGNELKLYDMSLLRDFSFQSRFKRGSNVMKDDKVYSTYHKWFNGLPYSYFSINGTEVAAHRYPMGEDRTLFHDGERWHMFIRSHPYYDRKVSYQSSIDFRTWTEPAQVAFGFLFVNDRVYSFTPFKIAGRWYGIANVYRIGNNGQNETQQPPYVEDEHTIAPVLYRADLFPSQWAFIASLPISICAQCFVTPVVQNDKIYLTTIESERRHTNWCNANENVAKPYYSRVLEMPLNDFKREYIN